jgi:hypothetical protein
MDEGVRFTVRDICAAIEGARRPNIQKMCDTLVELGVLIREETTEGPGGRTGKVGYAYRLGQVPPYPRPWSAKYRTHYELVRQIWSTIRIRGTFDIDQVMLTLTVRVTYDWVQEYLFLLTKCGFIRATRPFAHGRRRVYSLVRDQVEPPQVHELRAIVEGAK